ncbi:nucleotidyltransferase [Porphyromonas sp.]|uniref:nucleotidyltransferase n=1 Tax=Porphyromonas sp. TaxID=1924944 RepID=UPI0026DCDE11|nr:nucleotidyltransferase [Porphyromonas sp.]MDO4695605.1 nucleotidyltransferase [Porphyromonas sp.]MDO4771551.1 nucleotidyltransferase [Porphyromonas sp.]
MRPTLFILAAGMGARYGGLKQLDGVGPNGETIMDYSVYDAIRAGFGKIVFVIRKEFSDDFKVKILSKYHKHIPVEVVYQSVDALPKGFHCPKDRVKPWGTNHAVLMGKGVINEPFAVINADDFYGRHSFLVLADKLQSMTESKGQYCMVGYHIGNTLSESGAVSRGVCSVNAQNELETVVERTKIQRVDGQITFLDDAGEAHTIDDNTLVSMNMWGFTPDYFDYSEEAFVSFLEKNINNDKGEFYIPSVVNDLIVSSQAACKVLETTSKWFGVTYPADRPAVVENLKTLVEQGEYPSDLFTVFSA